MNLLIADQSLSPAARPAFQKARLVLLSAFVAALLLLPALAALR